MKDYVIVTDSCCDLPEALLQEWEIPMLPLSILFGTEHFYNRSGEGPDSHEFYERLYKGESAQTSAPNVEAFKDFFLSFLQEGKDILYLGFSSALSATYHNGCLAAEELREAYPQAEIVVIDTLSASLGQGLLLSLAVEEKRKGKTLAQVQAFVEETKQHVHHWFTVGNLVQLRRGGRLSAGKAVVGTLLQIKPVLKVDPQGRLVPVDTVKGRKKSIEAMLQKMLETVEHPEGQRVFISHGDCQKDAETLAAAIKEKLPVASVTIGVIGPVIGSHSGKDTLALFFVGSARTD